MYLKTAPDPHILLPSSVSSQYDPEGRTPLSIAVKCAREDVVYSLLMAQASPDIPDEGAYSFPLRALFLFLSKVYA